MKKTTRTKVVNKQREILYKLSHEYKQKDNHSDKQDYRGQRTEVGEKTVRGIRKNERISEKDTKI